MKKAESTNPCFTEQQQSAMKSATKSGFTLAEVLVASFIMVLGMTAISQLIITTMSASTLSRHTTAATTFAQSKMEEIIAGGSVPGGNGSETIDSYYNINWSSNEREGDLKKVKVVVDWTDHRGNKRDLEMSSLVCGDFNNLTGMVFSNYPAFTP